MKIISIYFGLLFLLAGTILAQELTGPEIIDKVRELMNQENVKGMMTQTIETTSGQLRTFEYEYFAANKGEKTLMRYTKPRRVKGLAFLITNYADDIWIYFPRTGRVLKKASHFKKQKVQGSDFTYEDMGSGEAWIEEYESRRLMDEKAEGFDCFKVEMVAMPEENPTYSKMVIWVRKSDFSTVRIAYYNDKGVHEKTLYLRDIQDVDGIPTAMTMVMENHLNNTRTEMKTISVTYNTTYPKNFFSERELKR